MVWSLYRKKEDDEGIFNYSGEKMEPLQFSNGKTQETVVEEVLKNIRNGKKLIFIRGVCGTGKSAIALNLAKNFKKTSIVVPIKNLQDQYEKDYTQKMFVLKDDGNPLKISMIKGRSNFSCPFAGGDASDEDLPCSIEIREKNKEMLMKYLNENPFTNPDEFKNIVDIRRMNIAPVCPYWSPLLPFDINPKDLEDVEKIKYKTINGIDFAVFRRKKGCEYFQQYEAYSKADVLIFNSAKYMIEVDMGRKPMTDLDIIDECDEFLDNFSNERKINLQRLQNALINLTPEDKEKRVVVKDLIHKINFILLDKRFNIDFDKLKNTLFSEIIQMVLKNPNLAEDEELNYYNHIVEIARSFERVLNETYVSIERVESKKETPKLFQGEGGDGENVIVSLVSINLKEKMRELTDQGNVMVMMSGTLHNEEVLRDIFGLEDFVIIEAETKMPGDINILRTGVEKNCNFQNFKSGVVSRERYLKMLDCILANCEGQTVVHVNAFSDLPSEEEAERMKFEHLISREEFKQIQKQSLFEIQNFLTKGKKTLFTTKCNRGIDFAGDKCSSVVLTKFPYPNIKNLFWKVLRQEQPDKFQEFYVDKAHRELIQRIARGIRFKGDSVKLLSPDVRVINHKFDKD